MPTMQVHQNLVRVAQLQSDVSAFPAAGSTPPPPSAHMFTGASGGQGTISASTLADIVNYAEPGEDLDWTKINEPRERKRLQNIINGRKYRERRLAAEGGSGSGGNYPGASGPGSSLSGGYGERRGMHDG